MRSLAHVDMWRMRITSAAHGAVAKLDFQGWKNRTMNGRPTIVAPSRHRESVGPKKNARISTRRHPE